MVMKNSPFSRPLESHLLLSDMTSMSDELLDQPLDFLLQLKEVNTCNEQKELSKRTIHQVDFH